jgi:hypothetical protein
MICFNSWECDIVRLLYATVHSGTKGQPGVPEAPLPYTQDVCNSHLACNKPLLHQLLEPMSFFLLAVL